MASCLYGVCVISYRFNGEYFYRVPGEIAAVTSVYKNYIVAMRAAFYLNIAAYKNDRTSVSEYLDFNVVDYDAFNEDLDKIGAAFSFNDVHEDDIAALANKYQLYFFEVRPFVLDPVISTDLDLAFKRAKENSLPTGLYKSHFEGLSDELEELPETDQNRFEVDLE